MFITSRVLRVFWSLLATSLFAIGCSTELSEQPSQQPSSEALFLSGSVVHNGEALADAHVYLLEVLEDGEMYLLDEVVTDKDGAFSINLDHYGSYAIAIAKVTTVGTYVLPQSDLIDVDIIDTGADLGEINLRFTETDHSPSELATQTGALGLGIGCLGIGCSFKYSDMGDYKSNKYFKWLCCGWSVCIAGMEGCIPLGVVYK